MKLDVWWSIAAQCWRVQDGDILFSYYAIDEVVGHFIYRPHPATALMGGVHTQRYYALVSELQAAGVVVEYTPRETQ